MDFEPEGGMTTLISNPFSGPTQPLAAVDLSSLSDDQLKSLYYGHQAPVASRGNASSNALAASPMMI